MMTRTRTGLSILVLLLVLPSLARAQAAPVPKWTVGVTGGRVESLGTSNLFVRTKSIGSVNGLALDVSGGTSGRLGVAAEFGLFDAASALVGARWTPVCNSRKRVFGQVLGGPVLVTLEDTAFAIQTGGGVDFQLSSMSAFRLQADYRMMTHDGNRSHQLRAVVGFVLNSRN